jgi:polyhydroxyalkanoate synthesis regulator protein
MATSHQPPIIKRYAGARFYDGVTATYLALADVAARARNGEVVVHDAETGEDVTGSLRPTIVEH